MSTESLEIKDCSNYQPGNAEATLYDRELTAQEVAESFDSLLESLGELAV